MRNVVATVRHVERKRSGHRRGPLLRVTELVEIVRRIAGGRGRELSKWKQGTFLGIIGPNGAGKTTLFNLLNGFLRPDHGRVVLEGHDLVGLKPNRICRLGRRPHISGGAPFARMSVLQNVVVGALRGGAAPMLRRSPRARAALDARRARSTARMRRPVTLTNKELRLMELARALASVGRACCCWMRRSPGWAATKSRRCSR